MAEQRQGNYLVRESYYQFMTHMQDDIKYTGYNWRDKLFDKTLSSYLLADPKRSQIMGQIKKLMVYIIDNVSTIKKAMNYTVDKNYKYLN